MQRAADSVAGRLRPVALQACSGSGSWADSAPTYPQREHMKLVAWRVATLIRKSLPGWIWSKLALTGCHMLRQPDLTKSPRSRQRRTCSRMNAIFSVLAMAPYVSCSTPGQGIKCTGTCVCEHIKHWRLGAGDVGVEAQETTKNLKHDTQMAM